MFFPSFRRRPRRRHQSNRQIEQLEPRELLVAQFPQLTSLEVTNLLNRASMATSSNDAIIAVVDRGGHILGVRVEQDVLTAIGNLVSANGTVDPGVEQDTLVYAIDGAVAKARTAAFFANGTLDTRIVPDITQTLTGAPTPSVGPLTSRTIRNISQSTITQREVQSNPSIADPDSTLRGPGFVAPIGVGQHFPPGIPNTPQVDLFAIEHTNRDGIVHPGIDGIKGTSDDITLAERFNIDPNWLPNAAKTLDAPESYGFTSGLEPDAQARGIATLPGGLPIYRTFNPTTGMLEGLDVIGGIGVFFPGTSNSDGTAGPIRIGDASFEQNFPTAQNEFDRTNAPKVLESEYAALFAIGGGVFGGLTLARDRIVGGDFPIPFGRIDLVGITLQIIGPTPGVSGVRTIEAIRDQIPQGKVKLRTALNATDTMVKVNDVSLLPAAPGFKVLIDNEVLLVTAIDGLNNQLTVTRHISGTLAKAHSNGKAVIAGTVELAAAIPNTTDTSITVTDSTVLPTGTGYFIRVENEILKVTSVANNLNGSATLTVERGKNRSAAAVHANGKQVVAGSGADQNLKITSSVAGAALPIGATTITVPDGLVFPAAPFSINIDSETISVTGVSATTLTVLPTTASHAIGATIRTVDNVTAANGRAIAEGTLVTPHDSPILSKMTSSVATPLLAADTSLVVLNASVFPTGTFSIRIDEEVIVVTSIVLATNTLNIVRGPGAVDHGSGSIIFTTQITAAEVTRIIQQAIIVAGDTESSLSLPNDHRRVRAAIRLKVHIANINDLSAFRGNNQGQLNRVSTTPGAAAIMVMAVADTDGNVLGLYRMHDSTIFSIDVAVAKARNTAYYAGPNLQDPDRVDDDQNGVPDANVPTGVAFTNRTFRFLVEPRFPQGVDGSKPGSFSILNEGVHTNVPSTPFFQTQFLTSKNPNIAVHAAENNGGPAKASDFKTVLGFDSFHPGTNFRLNNYIANQVALGNLVEGSAAYNNLVANQDGIVFFPGSTPIYAGSSLTGGFGISGDGVDQDDVVTFYGAQGFLPPDATPIADEFKVRNTRLPYQKFNRNPFG